MVKKYIPKQKDIIYLDLSPTVGHEQKGLRPALVISNDIFNKKIEMAIVCPITSNTKYFPTHYNLQNTKKIKGSVLCEHIRSIDYKNRKVQYVEKCDNNDFMEILSLLESCVEK